MLHSILVQKQKEKLVSQTVPISILKSEKSSQFAEESKGATRN